MLFKTAIISALVAANQLATVSAAPSPRRISPPKNAKPPKKDEFTDLNEVKVNETYSYDDTTRQSFYDEASMGVLDFHETTKRSIIKERDEYLALPLKKRQDKPWHPDRMYTSDFGVHEWYYSAKCDQTDRRKWSYGTLVRTITYPDPESGAQVYNYWRNGSSYWTENFYPPGQKSCHMYGDPKYNPGAQCVDKIWNPSARAWEPRATKNANSFWTSGNETYNNHTVRTIYDCLLNRTAIEYKTVVQEFGFSPVQYVLDNIKYYRFYDKNNFAWFVACPKAWPPAWKRNLEERKTDPHKRCNGCRGVNPVWDFYAPRNRNPLADTTDIHDYQTSLQTFYGQADAAFTEHHRYAITYWPPGADRDIIVNGEACVQAAVSRPGLRHWTMRFFDEAEMGWVQESKEYRPTPAEYN